MSDNNKKKIGKRRPASLSSSRRRRRGGFLLLLVLLAVAAFAVAFLNTLLLGVSRSTRTAVEQEEEEKEKGNGGAALGDRLQTFLKSSSSVTNRGGNATAAATPSDINFSACLLIKDDGDILDEWLAYHYFALDLRFLVVAVDPSSETSPLPTFRKWTRALPDLTVVAWTDGDYMPKSFLQRGYNVPPRYIDADANRSKWHAGYEDPEQVRADKLRINNHRFRQKTFYGACLKRMRAERRTLVFHVDTDEYIVVNPVLRKGHNNDVAAPPTTQNRQQHAVAAERTLIGASEISRQSSVANFVRDTYRDEVLRKLANFPCVSMPRLLFGSVERKRTDGGGVARTLSVSASAFNESSFETMRWTYHASYEDKERNAQPKVIVDISQVNAGDEMLVKPKPFSIHRPSKGLCRRIDQIVLSQYQRYPLVVNHYLGSRERYFVRNDTRRSLRAYNSKAFVQEGPDDWISGWVNGFIGTIGQEKARQLLEKHIVN